MSKLQLEWLIPRSSASQTSSGSKLPLAISKGLGGCNLHLGVEECESPISGRRPLIGDGFLKIIDSVHQNADTENTSKTTFTKVVLDKLFV